MKIDLHEYPKDVTIIQGFPGFGMVGSISTEFLLNHMNMRLIGTVQLDEVSPMVAIHEGKLIPQVGIHYSSDTNIVVLHFLVKGQNNEWLFADVVKQVADMLCAKEIISLEGVSGESEIPVYGFSTLDSKALALKEKGFSLLTESIILGVSAALLLKNIPLTAFFAITKSTLPDSNAAAELIKALDSYLDLSVDYEPLHAQAKLFEEKIKGMLVKSEDALKEKENSMLNYMS